MKSRASLIKKSIREDESKLETIKKTNCTSYNKIISDLKTIEKILIDNYSHSK